MRADVVVGCIRHFFGFDLRYLHKFSLHYELILLGGQDGHFDRDCYARKHTVADDIEKMPTVGAHPGETSDVEW